MRKLLLQSRDEGETVPEEELQVTRYAAPSQSYFNVPSQSYFSAPSQSYYRSDIFVKFNKLGLS